MTSSDARTDIPTVRPPTAHAATDPSSIKAGRCQLISAAAIPLAASLTTILRG